MAVGADYIALLDLGEDGLQAVITQAHAYRKQLLTTYMVEIQSAGVLSIPAVSAATAKFDVTDEASFTLLRLRHAHWPMAAAWLSIDTPGV